MFPRTEEIELLEEENYNEVDVDETTNLISFEDESEAASEAAVGGGTVAASAKYACYTHTGSSGQQPRWLSFCVLCPAVPDR